MRRLVMAVPLVACLAAMIGTGILSLDFGPYWDDHENFQAVKYSLENAILLPNFYDYPSVPYWLNLGATLPDLVHAIRAGYHKPGQIKAYLIQAVDGYAHDLNTRGLFLVISSLVVVWVYLLIREIGGSWIQALVGASIVGLSWEVNYQIRWVAPDGIMMQFAALTMLCCAKAWKGASQDWLYGAAVAAGLTLGSKYPGGLIIVPVLITAYWVREEPKGNRMLVASWAKLLAVFGLTYLITTPGTILQPLAFAGGVTHDIVHYATEQANYTVSRGWQHLLLLGTYLSTVMLSRYPGEAGGLFALCALGAYAVFRRSRRLGTILVSFPLVYAAYFVTQGVMIVRNYLVLAPFLAVLAAEGVAFLWRLAKSWPWKTIVGASVGVALAINAAWLGYSSWTVHMRNRTELQDDRAAANYMRLHRDETFLVSAEVRVELITTGIGLPANATPDPAASFSSVLLYMHEDPHYKLWPANHPDTLQTWFGPWEVNLNYYPSWQGQDRMVVIGKETAKSLGIIPEITRPGG